MVKIQQCFRTPIVVGLSFSENTPQCTHLLIYQFFLCQRSVQKNLSSHAYLPLTKKKKKSFSDMLLGAALEILLHCVYMTVLKQLSVNYANMWHLTTKLTRKQICEQSQASSYQHNNLSNGIYFCWNSFWMKKASLVTWVVQIQLHENYIQGNGPDPATALTDDSTIQLPKKGSKYRQFIS